MKRLPDIDNEFPDKMVPAIDHHAPEDDDTGMPENPIFSDFSKFRWQSHRRTGGIQSPKRSRENTDGPRNN